MARYLIDVNLPRYFSIWANDDCRFVADIDATWTDTQIWRHAVEATLTIVTKDADFSDRVLITDEGPRVIHRRAANMRMRDFRTFLSGRWSEICRLSEMHRLVQVYQDRIECIE